MVGVALFSTAMANHLIFREQTKQNGLPMQETLLHPHSFATHTQFMSLCLQVIGMRVSGSRARSTALGRQLLQMAPPSMGFGLTASGMAKG